MHSRFDRSAKESCSSGAQPRDSYVDFATERTFPKKLYRYVTGFTSADVCEFCFVQIVSLTQFEKELPKAVVSLLWACLMSMAEVYIRLGQYHSAEDAFSRALVICQELHGKDHLLVARVLQPLADLHFWQQVCPLLSKRK